MSVLPLPTYPSAVRIVRQLASAFGFVLSCVSGVSAEQDAAELLQQSYGLRKISAGDVWLLPAELRLQDQLAALEPQYRSIIGLQKRLDEAVQQNGMLWTVNRQRIESLRRSLASKDSDDPQRRPIEQQIRDLESQAVEPSQLAGVPAVRQRLIELINLRLRLGLLLVSIRQLHEELSSGYAQLLTAPEVSRALATLGTTHRLGPLQQGYRTQLRRLEKYDQIVATDWLPIYLQSDRTRFGGLVNDRLPLMFTWEDGSEPALLTASMVETAGLVLPDDAERVPLALPDRRRLEARRMVVPSLRFGGQVLRDVAVLVLPPEGEDLGARIGPGEFSRSGHRVELQPDRLRMVIRTP